MYYVTRKRKKPAETSAAIEKHSPKVVERLAAWLALRHASLPDTKTKTFDIIARDARRIVDYAKRLRVVLDKLERGNLDDAAVDNCSRLNAANFREIGKIAREYKLQVVGAQGEEDWIVSLYYHIFSASISPKPYVIQFELSGKAGA